MELSSTQNCILKRQVFCLIVISLAVLVCMDEDYYSLLAVSRASSSREIRQAFKKLALKLHPDKNKNDPDAHDKFLKINRAYEVLKDDDLRKKYDKYGEKGLEDQQQGGRYESWNFYRYDFGIYDDDPEIVTLDRGEFDGAVNSGELWFINFYSPRCSHCHDLAPTWREFAKEMEGLIRIGAVNCGDDRMLCRGQGINSYPSLYIFKAGMNPVKYFGDRLTDDLVNFAMNYVSSSVTELWAGNFRSSIERSFASGVGWLITFCADSGDCLSSQTRLKLAGMLEGLVSVGWMDCTIQADLCENLEITSSTTAYFPPGVILPHKNKDNILFFSSLDTREIYKELMEHLPDLEMLSTESLKDRLTYHRWLVFFSYGKDEQFYQPVFKKLAVILRDDHIQVGRFDCQSSPTTCKSLYINKPCVVAFKGKGIDEFEFHHGKVNLYDLVAFTKESVTSHVVTLGPQNFPENDRQPWLVDFFAPWCPPCRALLPELRKASKRMFGHVRFGTLDCTIHEGLCNTYNIRAYPTTVIFNQSNIHEYGGHHSAEEILEFIEDLRHPSVVTLTPANFKELVKERSRDEIWLVDYYAPWCGPCQALMPEWKRLARHVSGLISVGSVDCQKYSSLCSKEYVNSYPEIRLYPANRDNPHYYFAYNGWQRDAYSLKTWALTYLPKMTIDLTSETFDKKVLSGEDHWLIDFYAPWCGPCRSFAPEYEFVARLLKGKVKAGKVDCQEYGYICQKAGIRAYPTVKFYPYVGSKKKNVEGEYLDSRDANDIVKIVTARIGFIKSQQKAHQKDEL
ncbi:PREDICTED: dnaJ homolog subfamily C member 10 [Nanorana parkeri]|uniref:dnaJ homolog subfamily C member 10 n=1 Tax=Nanorana parkeri TaxID=125878 RepID=UPI000854DB3A|nr:PREDICTED: dnaJ homolog subfamily C member 10 [Nanorana parkeri]